MADGHYSTKRGFLIGTALLVPPALVLAALLGLELAVRRTKPPSLALETSPVVLDRDDRLLGAFTVADGRWRLRATIDDVDPRFVDMLLAYEDRRFFEHAGVDPRALLRAAAQALMHGRIRSGGSTLTMQVVRLSADETTRTLAGKWRQILRALALERVADKHAILTAYLNRAPYGGNLEGIRAASLAWLGKEPRRLTVAEAALLVALPQAPQARRPDEQPDAARRARDRVLDRVLAAGLIEADTARAARSEPRPARRRALPRLAPHAARRALAARPHAEIHRLTIDGGLQARLEALAAEHAAARGERISAAILVADHATGEILASVGSAGLLDQARGGFLDMTLALRSPGSTLKPLIYGLAFEQGIAHPESLIEDRPSGFGGYAPGNFDGVFRGTVTVREALRSSLNVPAVTMLEAVGPTRLLARLRRTGAAPRLPADATSAGLAIGLGGVGMTLRGLVTVYAAIARGGSPAVLFERRDAPPPRPSGAPVLSPVAAWQVASILSGAERADSRGADVAVKTGTAYGYRDAWAIGFDGRRVIGVWLGRPDGAAVPGLTGADAALPLLRDGFARIGVPVPLPGPPSGVLMASTARLPPTLARVRRPAASGADPDSVEIAFPPPGATLDVGTGALRLKVRNGTPPFVWLADGRPIAREPYARETLWQPPGPGYARISVIDARGRSSRVEVRLE